jgi:hypothetical protein
MDELGLFTAALGLSGPWRVARTEFDPERFQLDLYLDFDRGARFPCPAAGCAHDDWPGARLRGQTWRHLDFFQHKAFLHARGTAGALPRAWRAAGQRVLGTPGLGGSRCCSRHWCSASRRRRGWPRSRR